MIKNITVYILTTILVLIWGTLILHFFPFAHFLCSWLFFVFITVLIAKFGRNIYIGVIFNFLLLFLEIIFSRANRTFDDITRDLDFFSFSFSNLLVLFIWCIYLFIFYKHKTQITKIQICKSYLPFLILISFLFEVLYILIYKAWFYK